MAAASQKRSRPFRHRKKQRQRAAEHVEGAEAEPPPWWAGPPAASVTRLQATAKRRACPTPPPATGDTDEEGARPPVPASPEAEAMASVPSLTVVSRQTIEELQTALHARGLETEGKKYALVNRLFAALCDESDDRSQPSRPVHDSRDAIAAESRQGRQPEPRGSIARLPALGRRASSDAAPAFSYWIYKPANGAHMDVRGSPSLEDRLPYTRILPNEKFMATERLEAEGAVFLRLVHLRGWVLESKPDVGTLCEPCPPFEDPFPALGDGGQLLLSDGEDETQTLPARAGEDYWRRAWSRKYGIPFYWNPHTDESVWELNPGVSDQAVQEPSGGPPSPPSSQEDYGGAERMDAEDETRPPWVATSATCRERDPAEGPKSPPEARHPWCRNREECLGTTRTKLVRHLYGGELRGVYCVCCFASAKKRCPDLCGVSVDMDP